MIFLCTKWDSKPAGNDIDKLHALTIAPCPSLSLLVCNLTFQCSPDPLKIFNVREYIIYERNQDGRRKISNLFANNL